MNMLASVELETKKCGSCQKQKTFQEFGKNKSRTDGLQVSCKQCRNDSARQQYASNPTHQLELAEKSRRKAGKKPRLQKPLVLNQAQIKFWDYIKNVDIDPTNIHDKSAMYAWRCEKGHHWQRKATHQKNVCNECSHQEKILKKIAMNPLLEIEWHPTLNDTKLMVDTKLGTSKNAWWQCSTCANIWQAQIYSRATGVGCPKCANEQKSYRSPNSPLANPLLILEWSIKNDKNPTEVSVGSSYKAIWDCSKCGHEWPAQVTDRTLRGSGCPKCSMRISKPEQELQNWAQQLGLEIISNTRKIIYPYELDIYFPKKAFAIEFNGVHWHTERAGKDKYYHHRKWQACKERDINLIQIWEDDWRANKDLIINMLSHKLGVSSEKTIYGRKTKAESITRDQAQLFLQRYHLQGAANGFSHIGLKTSTDELVAVMTLKHTPGTNNMLEIVRYATSCTVPGGFTKLLAFAERSYQPSAIVTFSDNTVSDGALYAASGFDKEAELPPDYKYLVNGKRFHKFGYRLARFKNDPNLLWDPELTERELADLNQIDRIWDAGKHRWRKNYLL